jgi:hypothetical protein
MKHNQAVEREIREILASESDAISLSNQLFSPQGLFNRLAKTEADRTAVAGSALFKEAQKRLFELKRIEAAQFAKAVEQSQHSASGAVRLVKIEPV